MSRKFLLVIGAALAAPSSAQEILATFEGLSSPDELGASSVGVGDLDGDGFDDFAFGVPRGQSTNGNTGYVDVISGRTQSLLRRIPGTNNMQRFGEDLAAGDLDGDGLGVCVTGHEVLDFVARD